MQYKINILRGTVPAILFYMAPNLEKYTYTNIKHQNQKAKNLGIPITCKQ